MIYPGDIHAKVPEKPYFDQNEVLHFREKWAKFQTKAQKNSKLNVNQENINNHDPYGRAGDLRRIREIPGYSGRAGIGKWHRVSAKFEFRYESLNRKLSLIPFVYTLVIGCPKKEKIIREKEFEQKKEKLGFKFNPGLALSLRTTGSSPFGTSQG